MDEVMISLAAPVSSTKIERWVEGQVDRLRAEARPSGVRLGQLSPAYLPPGADWLVEVERENPEVRLEDDSALNDILTDMALLGLRPQLLVASPRAPSAVPHAGAPTTRRPPRHGTALLSQARRA